MRGIGGVGICVIGLTSAASIALQAARPARPWNALEARKASIGKIEVEIADVFDLAKPEENIWIGRTANSLHASTREAVIRRVLLFSEGQPVRERRIYETERLLRALPFVKEARIDPVIQPDGTVVAKVHVRDAWTTQVSVGFSQVGGQKSMNLGVDEKNFLGTGKSVAYDLAKDHERSTWGLAYGDPQLFGSRWTMKAHTQYLSDGFTRSLQVERPFFALDTPWSTGVALSQSHVSLSLYDHGVQIYHAPFVQNEVRFFGAKALFESENRVWRGGLLLKRQDTSYGPILESNPPGALAAPILGFAQLIESDAPVPTPSQQESLSQILRAGWHLLKLIDQILDLAKVESGRMPLSQESVSLADVLLECESLVEHQVQQRGIAIIFPVFEQPCYVLADHTRVKQVVVNLLSNAIKYNATQGRVEVTCLEPSPGRVRVCIRDTGTGLHPEQLGQLFQAFNRLGQEAGIEEGTGIGLVVAKRLVELMGGVIGVESVVGAGSMFWFELNAGLAPNRSSLGEADEGCHPAITRRPGLHTLLYVEDNSANLRLVEQIICRHPDLRLLTAERGAKGIEIAHESLPDLILMDINLPDINGFDVLMALRADPATAHILVIALSANAMPRDIERARRAGFFRYLTKPIKIDAFMQALDEALECSDRLAQGVPQP